MQTAGKMNKAARVLFASLSLSNAFLFFAVSTSSFTIFLIALLSSFNLLFLFEWAVRYAKKNSQIYKLNIDLVFKQEEKSIFIEAAVITLVYFLTLLFPFRFVPTGFAILAVLIFSISFFGGLTYNPTTAYCGYRAHDVLTQKGKKTIVLSRKTLNSESWGTEINVVRLFPGIFVAIN